MKIAKQLAEEHWNYVREVLLVGGINRADLYKYEFHYKSAFIHGFKHGIEYFTNILFSEKQEDYNVKK